MSPTKTAKQLKPALPFAAPQVLVLAIVSGRDPSVAFRINRHDSVIGRGDEADIAIDDAEVSQQHCVLRVNGSVFTMMDRGSLNGTFVNARRLRAGVAHRIRHLDEIQVGETHLILLSGCFKHAPVKP